MRPLRVLLASLLIASPAVAVTTGTVSGSTTIPYACDMTLPGDITMTPGTTTAIGTDTLPYSQNSGTVYELSALTLTQPAGVTTTVGTLTFEDKDGSTVVTNSSKTVSATGNVNGIEAGAGALIASVTDPITSVLAAGAYTVSSTLSCSAAP